MEILFPFQSYAEMPHQRIHPDLPPSGDRLIPPQQIHTSTEISIPHNLNTKVTNSPKSLNGEIGLGKRLLAPGGPPQVQEI